MELYVWQRVYERNDLVAPHARTDLCPYAQSFHDIVLNVTGKDNE